MSRATQVIVSKEGIVTQVLAPHIVRRVAVVLNGAYGRLRHSCQQLSRSIDIRQWPLYVLAFCLARVAVLGELSPFGLALVIAARQVAAKQAGWLALAVLAGAVSLGQPTAIIGSGAALAATLYGKRKSTWSWLWRGGLIAGLAAVGGLLAEVWGGEPLTIYLGLQIGIFIASVLCLSCVFFYGLPLLQGGAGAERVDMNSEGIICTLLVLALAISGCGQLMVGDYYLRNIASAFLVMTLGAIGGAGIGAAGGAMLDLLAVVIWVPHMAVFATNSLALSGLLSGCFRMVGKAGVAAGFLLGQICTVLYFGQASEVVQMLSEALLATTVFLLVPVRILGSWRMRFSLPVGGRLPAVRVSEAANKLKETAEILCDLAQRTATGRDAAHEWLQREQIQLIDDMGEQACATCSRRHICWETEFYHTYQAFIAALSAEDATLPSAVAATCLKPAEMAAALQWAQEKYKTIVVCQRKAAGQQRMIVEQLRAAGGMLHFVSQEILREPESNQQLATTLKQAIRKTSCRVNYVTVQGSARAAAIDIIKPPCGGRRECEQVLLPLAAEVTQEKMTMRASCPGSQGTNWCRLSLQGAKRFGIKTGAAWAAKHEQSVSGDTCAVSAVPQGRTAMLLSDGIGSGQAAAQESRLAVECVQRLLNAGFGLGGAVRIVNAVLMLKNPGETFATLDLTMFDPYTGEAEFLKIGSSPSFVKRVHEVGMIKSASLPAGILQQVEIEPVSIQLASGDFIIMVSDGIMDIRPAGQENWLINYLRRIPSREPQQVADQILQEARRQAGGSLRDDMTVLVAKISEKAS